MQKTSDFSKFMVCPHGQEGEKGFESVRTFCGQWRVSIFRDFVRIYFMGCP